MVIIWKDTSRQEAIFYRDGHQLDYKIVTSSQVEELIKEKLYKDEYIVEGFHLPSFDGLWPTQEDLDYCKEHRFDFLKDIKFIFIEDEVST